MKHEETVTAVNKIISEYSMPLTLRQIYYRLVVAGLIPNRRSAYNSLSSQLVTARERGEVDDHRIVDRSRSIIDSSFNSPEDFNKAIQRTLETRYLRRFWESQPAYVEVWVEKDALSQVISTAIHPFNTIIAPSRGYSSYSYLRDASNRIIAFTNEHATILHFADHDPSGLDMTRDLQDRLDRYCEGVKVEVKRMALTFDQVKEYDLIPNPTKLADPRSYGYSRLYGDECWELDAIEPDELMRLCEEAVAEQIEDIEAWDKFKESEKQERQRISDLLKDLD